MWSCAAGAGGTDGDPPPCVVRTGLSSAPSLPLLQPRLRSSAPTEQGMRAGASAVMNRAVEAPSVIQGAVPPYLYLLALGFKTACPPA